MHIIFFQKNALTTNFIDTNNMAQLQSQIPRNTKLSSACTFFVSRKVFEDETEDKIREFAPLAQIIDITTSRIRHPEDPKSRLLGNN
jgi:hypothetical protein